ncbi:MAG TPA: hypothetical protein VGJ26_02305, partial [Pirellulales bacterium]
MIAAGCSRTANVPPGEKEPTKTGAAVLSEAGSEPDHIATEEQKARIAKLLNERLDGDMGYPFAQFANKLLANSRLHLSDGIWLMTLDRDVARAALQSPFPATYQPTLRELFDAIATQTSTAWQYNPSGKYVESDATETDKRAPTIFEFTPAQRARPFEVTLPAGWKSKDNGAFQS